MWVVGAGIYTNGWTVISGSETNVVALTNGITLLGQYGWKSTIIRGGAQMRGVYVGSNSVMSGFTITNGRAQNAQGGGIWCRADSLVVELPGY